MARPTTAKHHTQCSHCFKDMPPVKHKRPFAKMCHDCRGARVGTKGEVSQITIDLKIRNLKMTDEELGISKDAFK